MFAFCRNQLAKIRLKSNAFTLKIPKLAQLGIRVRRIVSVPSDRTAISALPPRHPTSSSSTLVEYTLPALNQEEDDLEVKLRRILDHVPVRVNNISSSSAGSGSGDFHQYRQMRRKEHIKVQYRFCGIQFQSGNRS